MEKLLIADKNGRLSHRSVKSAIRYAPVGRRGSERVFVRENRVLAYFSLLSRLRPEKQDFYSRRALVALKKVRGAKARVRRERRRARREKLEAEKQAAFQPEAPQAEQRGLFRVVAAVSFYATGPNADKYPEAIAHFRLTVYSRDPGRWENEAHQKLMDYVHGGNAASLFRSKDGTQNNRMEVEGLEVEEIDEDEAPRAEDSPEIEATWKGAGGGVIGRYKA